MKYVAFKEDEYQGIIKKIDRIDNYVRSKSDQQSHSLLYNAQEVCEYLKISRRTLARFIKDNKIPFIRNGRKLLFKDSDLRDYLQKNHHSDQSY